MLWQWFFVVVVLFYFSFVFFLPPSVSVKARLSWSGILFVLLIPGVFAGTWLTSHNFFEEACSAVLQIRSKVSGFLIAGQYEKPFFSLLPRF